MQTKKLFIWIWLVGLLVAGCQSKEPIIPKVLAEIPMDPGHPVEVATNPQTGYVYVTNEASQISIFKGIEHVMTLQTDEDKPGVMAVDEQRGWIYVAHEYEGSVTVMRDTEVVTTLDIAGRDPQNIAIEPTSGWAYVVSGYQKSEGIIGPREGNVTVIKGTEIIGTIPLGPVLATYVVVDPVNGYVYVGGLSGPVEDLHGDVVVLNGLEEVARFDVADPVKAMDVNPNTGDVYVLNRAIDRNLTQFNAGKLITTAEVEGPGGEVTNMRVHPVTGDIYVLDLLLQQVVIVRNMEDKLSVIGRTPVGRSPDKMVIDPFTGNVYVANFGDDTVSVIHGTETIATIEVGWYPYGIGVNPTNGWVYVSNTNDDSVTILGFED